MEKSMEKTTEKPNGPAAAALLAGGIGAAALGLVTLINETNSTSAFSKSLVWVQPVGGLSGKSSLAIIAFFLAWIILGLLWKDREVKFSTIGWISFLLLAIGLLGTFPPVWHLFGA